MRGILQTRDPAHHIFRNCDRGVLDINGTGAHRTETLYIHFTRIQRLTSQLVAIDVDREIGSNFAGDGGHAIETQNQGTILGREADAEVGGSKIVAILADIQSI